QFAVIAGIPELRRNLREAWRSPSAGLSTEDEHVMNNGSRAWANLDRLNPFVLFEVCRRFEELVIDCARLGDVKLFRHADDRIGCADLPTLGELRRGRQILRIALWRAAIHPSNQRVFVLLAQPSIV